ncbi:hypothetical protein GLOIN_2v1729740 [Rhizophagus irregularis DAOM 181602=DAOM 197198]|uniref:Uncharacterized protein n=1 Tax=Rhizophagus irregularis (strain DAOM 181602 / DAOM 197198 / MUCL 43194) TaxID=747089 RepID=A0A2P4NZK2_RHIID|nr:hypothetical protein GLOIN_2v1729740 [Rhizophagus irregularis DAOM 181602=DAOM 197198]POG58547.1 hypothetical protein GLOIN_2v1729740 [Rhizophagus irregularis DAOM 181602=DAOM 197198]|eukprot:XP_025165413.1 hypothetical protein GLOIN_2v1729740 [Rhizophagus irregularis DAOM 181602=DAOM 197198]
MCQLLPIYCVLPIFVLHVELLKQHFLKLLRQVFLYFVETSFLFFIFFQKANLF